MGCDSSDYRYFKRGGARRPDGADAGVQRDAGLGFHDLKSLTLALAGEVGEVAELVQWLPTASVPDATLRGRLGDELADVLLYLVRLADVAGVDLAAAGRARLARNEERFPADAVRGVAPERS